MRVLLFLFVFSSVIPSIFSQRKIYQFDLSIAESKGATLAEGLKSSDFDIQLRAAQQAATWGKAEHIQDLIFLLFNLRNSVTLPKHYETMAAAAYALGQIEGSDVQRVEALQTTILNSVDKKLVKESWMALAKLLPETASLGVRLEDAMKIVADYRRKPIILHDQYACLALAARKRINQSDFVKSILSRDEILNWEEEARVALAQVLSRTDYFFLSGNAPSDTIYKSKVKRWVENEKSKYVRIQFGRLASRYEWWTLLNDLACSEDEQIAEPAIQVMLSKDSTFISNIFWVDLKKKASAFNYMRVGIHFNQFDFDQIREVLRAMPNNSREQIELAGVWNENGHPDAQNFIMHKYSEAEDLFHRILWVRQMSNSYLFIDSLVINDFPTAPPALQYAITECVLEYAKSNPKYNEMLFPGWFAVLWTSQDAGVISLLSTWALENAERVKGNAFLGTSIKQALPLFQKTETVETYNALLDAYNATQMEEKFLVRMQQVTRPFPSEREWRKNQSCKVKLKTDVGTVVIKLNGMNAPESVANLLKLCSQHYYDSIAFHRVVPNFVVQAGCTRGDGMSGMPYVISSEFMGHNFAPLHIGMASAGKHTESAQWFITLAYTPNLNGRYTEFGEVVRGKKVLQKIQVGTRIRSMREQHLF
jgi:cyclophilin family peptidyl-prolyl cis-trans isomerase